MIFVGGRFCVLLSLMGCAVGGADSDTTCDRLPPLSYDNFGAGLLELHCTGCHGSLVPTERREGAPSNVNFDTYEGVLTWADRIEARAVPDGADMPPGGGPSADERALLGEWLDCTVIPEAARWEAQQ